MSTNPRGAASPIARAIEVAGSASAVARWLDVTPQAVHQVAKGDRPVPATWCQKIERETAGKVTARQLRPDVFPA